jgi:hypothetical protein
MVVVAQLVRALDCGSEGREFESRLSPLLLNNVFLGRTYFVAYRGYFPERPCFLYDGPNLYLFYGTSRGETGGRWLDLKSSGPQGVHFLVFRLRDLY